MMWKFLKADSRILSKSQSNPLDPFLHKRRDLWIRLSFIIIGVYFELNRVVYMNNSAVSLSEVGEGENALLCKTNKEECCETRPNQFGEFYYPSDIEVPIAREQQGFYHNRGERSYV